MIEQYPALAKQLGEPFMTDKLVPICLKWLNDNVHSIRIAAVNNLRDLSKLFGSQWAERNVIKGFLDLKTDSNYLHRLTPLFGIAELTTVVSPDVVKRLFCPVLSQMSKDKIPNIRMNVAKAIGKIRNHITNIGPVENAIESDLLSILNELKSDEDDDVKYYTKKAISIRR